MDFPSINSIPMLHTFKHLESFRYRFFSSFIPMNIPLRTNFTTGFNLESLMNLRKFLSQQWSEKKNG